MVLKNYRYPITAPKPQLYKTFDRFTRPLFDNFFFCRNNVSVEGATHRQVVELIKSCGDTLTLTVISVSEDEAERLEPTGQFDNRTLSVSEIVLIQLQYKGIFINANPIFRVVRCLRCYRSKDLSLIIKRITGSWLSSVYI